MAATEDKLCSWLTGESYRRGSLPFALLQDPAFVVQGQGGGRGMLAGTQPEVPRLKFSTRSAQGSYARNGNHTAHAEQATARATGRTAHAPSSWAVPFFLRAGARWPRPLGGAPAPGVVMETQRPQLRRQPVASADLAPATVEDYGAFKKLRGQNQEADGPGPLPAFLLAGRRLRHCGSDGAVHRGLRRPALLRLAALPGFHHHLLQPPLVGLLVHWQHRTDS